MPAHDSNRYFGILSQSSFGDYNTLCPNQTFTEEESQFEHCEIYASTIAYDSFLLVRSNFPESDLPPWELIEEFGPTPSGGQGFAAVVSLAHKSVYFSMSDQSFVYLGSGKSS